MSFKEVLFFRIPQFLQHHIKGKFQQAYMADARVLINSNMVKPNYNLEVLNRMKLNLIDFDSYKFFDTQIDLSHDLDWLKDQKNNISSSQTYYAYIKRQDFERFGDIKYVSEPSRFYFLPFIALKYVSTGSNQTLETIRKILNTWEFQNPFLNSIHWTSGIEVGIRGINLVYTHIVLLQNNVGQDIIEVLNRQLLFHYKYLKNHLSLYSSANNHLVAELAALVCIANYLDNTEQRNERKKWKNKLFNELLKQTAEDGMNNEKASHYHAEVCDLFLVAIVSLKSIGEGIPEVVLTRFKNQFEFIAHLEYDENVTEFGDSDNGFIINPYFDKNFSIYQSLLNSANIEFGSKFRTKYDEEHEFDFRNFLLFGAEGIINQDQNVRIMEDRFFETSGYAFLYNHTSKTKVTFDLGKIGDDISGAHGHSDILHFTYSTNGVPILIDAGTYQYHSRFEKWRTYFRGIKGHNTISINKRDQAQANSRMSWLNQPISTLINYTFNKDRAIIKASHDGFREQGIIHKREIAFDKLNDSLVIIDELDQINKLSEKKEFQMYLNINPKLNVDHNKNEICIFNDRVSIKISNPLFKEGRIYRGDELKMIGWYSPEFGHLKKGIAFCLEQEFEGNQKLITRITSEK